MDALHDRADSNNSLHLFALCPKGSLQTTPHLLGCGFISGIFFVWFIFSFVLLLPPPSGPAELRFVRHFSGEIDVFYTSPSTSPASFQHTLHVRPTSPAPTNRG